MAKLDLIDCANNLVKVVRTCPQCGKEQSLQVNYEEYQNWRDGMLIQRAFKSLTAGQREILMTGICEPCWDAMFNFEEDEIYVDETPRTDPF